MNNYLIKITATEKVTVEHVVSVAAKDFNAALEFAREEDLTRDTYFKTIDRSVEDFEIDPFQPEFIE